MKEYGRQKPYILLKCVAFSSTPYILCRIHYLHWWDGLTEQGDAYGYHLNASKSLLLVKERAYDEAVALFAGTGVQIVEDGCRHLGAAWGTPEFVSSFVESKVTDWTRQVSRLSDFARTQPQAAYSAFVHGLQGKWSFLSQTLEISSEEFGGLEAVIRERLILALTGRLSPSSVERLMLSFPCRDGGLGLSIPTAQSCHYAHSRAVTNELRERIVQADPSLASVADATKTAKRQVRTAARASQQQLK